MRLLLKEINVKFQNTTYNSVNTAASLWFYNKNFKCSDEIWVLLINITRNIFWQKKIILVFSSRQMGLHSFRTEKYDKMIFPTDNDEDIFDSVFWKKMYLVTLELRIIHMCILFLNLKANQCSNKVFKLMPKLRSAMYI